MSRSASLAAALGAAACAIGLTACSAPPSHTDDTWHVDIRRTSLGVPHILARDWPSLGYGVGYAEAQDDLCTLADSFVTYRGERSAFFGADARPASAASFGQPRNLDADFFFRAVSGDAAVARYRDAQPSQVRQLAEGFAAGYDRYLSELRAGSAPGAHATCRAQAWVRPIDANDVYRRFIAATLAGGAARFVSQIANAQPPSPQSPQPPQARQTTTSIKLTDAQLEFGGHPGIGSNAFAFGAKTTRDGSSMLFGNPHWYWHGADRFYVAQLTIPGKLNVAGASFLGVPAVMMGFNDHIAWTHTVSSARRFGIFQLTLAPHDPTHYEVDGHDEAMSAEAITVQTRSANGTLTPVTRTLYRSRYGALVDLSSLAPALAWNGQHAFALRDINADNPRVFEHFLAWGAARSLDDFIAIQKRYAASPWVNTFAIGRGDPRVWFADIGAIPDVPDTLMQTCTPPLGRAFDARVPGVPFLDGSRSACDWRHDAGAPQHDGLPVSQMASLLRDDYVGNFNGSYWLTNPWAPLTGLPVVAGETGVEQTSRTRLGHQIAGELMHAPGGMTRDDLETAVLDSRSMSAQLFRAPLIDAVCKPADQGSSNAAPIDVTLAPTHEEPVAHTVDLRDACKVLQQWNGTGQTDARGANLWDEFWRRAGKLPEKTLYRVPFDPHAPLATPSGLATGNPGTVDALRAALAGAVLALQRHGFALDSTRGELLYTQRNGQKIALFGGCDPDGYFTAVCAQHPLDNAGYAMDRSGHGDTWLQVVNFGQGGKQDVVADMLLATSLSDDPASPHFADATQQFARHEWLRFPFSEAAIESDPALVVTRLRGQR